MPRFPRPLLAGGAIVVAALTALIIALALSGGSPASGPGAVASTGATLKREPSAATLWLNLAACLRSHGYPVPDPNVLANGTADWGGATGNIAFKRAMAAIGFSMCKHQLQALPAADVNPPPRSAKLRQLLLFARCMRTHGLSDWPDPHPDGTFPLDAHLLALGKTGTRTQMAACGRYLEYGSVSVSPGSVPAGQQTEPASRAGG